MVPSEEIDVTVAKKTKTSRTYIDPPLFSFSISNPVNYLRKWWTRVISREGIDFRLRIHPVTAFVIIIMVGGAAFGAGRITVPPVVTQLIPQWIMKPTPTPDPWKETAFSGILQKNSSGTFYLVTPQEAQAVALEVPSSVKLESFVGKRIFTSGKYNLDTRVLVISDASQMEVLLQVAPIMRRTPMPKSTIKPGSTPEVTPGPSPSPTPAL